MVLSYQSWLYNDVIGSMRTSAYIHKDHSATDSPLLTIESIEFRTKWVEYHLA